MGPIRNLFSTSPDLKRTDSGKKAGKAESSYQKNDALNKVAGNGAGKSDQVEISTEGRQLLSLKAEAQKYISDVKNSRAVTAQELEGIKEKIASKHYFNDEVIEKVVDKMMNISGNFGE
ncbi:MAG TPA: flagellar biosynthesis anti-sigma factor FlgM [Caldithrix abyssi]|uniref:Flagellar biosynthesis anti-sigma factor FlgM n=1 Tax=Caldithrix abyssi TaxID=187145 RepID=A0A7V1LJI6_CALAY|nr:flagellar biosynthesis anti-sigma factor FlgM [Caldithrix abyssi]